MHMTLELLQVSQSLWKSLSVSILEITVPCQVDVNALGKDLNKLQKVTELKHQP